MLVHLRKISLRNPKTVERYLKTLTTKLEGANAYERLKKVREKLER